MHWSWLLASCALIDRDLFARLRAAVHVLEALLPAWRRRLTPLTPLEQQHVRAVPASLELRSNQSSSTS
jgi:hypothetical protein